MSPRSRPTVTVVGRRMDRDPLVLETSIPGLFAAGDARHGSTKPTAGAVGGGAVAAALVHRRPRGAAGPSTLVR